MRRIVVILAVLALVGMAAASYTVAQDATGTPEAEAEFCATPAASPVASPEGSPSIDTDASPEEIATEVIGGVASGLDVVVCGTPFATPPA